MSRVQQENAYNIWKNTHRDNWEPASRRVPCHFSSAHQSMAGAVAPRPSISSALHQRSAKALRVSTAESSSCSTFRPSEAPCQVAQL